jgi:hypothetical protein
MSRTFVRYLLAGSGVVILCGSLQAGFSDWTRSLSEKFDTATHSQEVLASAYSSTVLKSDHLALKYAGFHYRYFWDFQREGEPGPWSFFVGGYAERPFEGPGSYIIGVSSGIRWSHPVESLGIRTYVQVSVGIFGNDIYRDETQYDIGSFIEFRDNITLGVAKPIQEGTELFLELALEHVSNGGIDPRNGGVNLIGLSMGLHY